MKNYKKILRSERGFTIAEVLIAALISGIVLTASFSFYSKMSSQGEAQFQLSDAQLNCRNSALEVKKTLRMAGFKLSGHNPYYINNDTLMVFMNKTNPVDTIKYYLVEYNEVDYKVMPNLPDSIKMYWLMKRENSNQPAFCTDYITSFSVTTPSSNEAIITISALTAMPDFDQTKDNGYKMITLTEHVHMRNVS